MPVPHQDHKDYLDTLFRVAIAATAGCERVYHAMRGCAREICVVAVGKCAVAMAVGAYRACGDQVRSSFIVTKNEQLPEELYKKSGLFFMKSSHPVPDQRSLDSGSAMLTYIRESKHDLVFLISGGTSSLVEVLPDTISLNDLRRVTDWMLSHGYSINEMNAVRKRISLIKGGKILRYLDGRNVEVKLISDVPGDDVSVIGSGWFSPEKSMHGVLSDYPVWLKEMINRNNGQCIESETKVLLEIVASNRQARQAIIAETSSIDMNVFHCEQEVTGNVVSVAERLANQLISGDDGLYIWGGETTVNLPASPGIGGRNLQLALLVAEKIHGHGDITFLAASTDGDDGVSGVAGAVVDAHTISKGERLGLSVSDYIARADAATYLHQTGHIISTGATGTNVMDIMIGMKVKTVKATNG